MESILDVGAYFRVKDFPVVSNATIRAAVMPFFYHAIAFSIKHMIKTITTFLQGGQRDIDVHETGLRN